MDIYNHQNLLRKQVSIVSQGIEIWYY